MQNLKEYLQHSPKLKAWLWFIFLWLASLSAIFILTYPIKLLIKLAS